MNPKDRIIDAHRINCQGLLLDVLSAALEDDPSILSYEIETFAALTDSYLKQDFEATSPHRIVVTLLTGFIGSFTFPLINESAILVLKTSLPRVCFVFWEWGIDSLLDEHEADYIAKYYGRYSQQTLHLSPIVWMNFGASFGYVWPFLLATTLCPLYSKSVTLFVYVPDSTRIVFRELLECLDLYSNIVLVHLAEENLSRSQLSSIWSTGGLFNAMEAPMRYLDMILDVPSHIRCETFARCTLPYNHHLSAISTRNRHFQVSLYRRACKTILKGFVKSTSQHPIIKEILTRAYLGGRKLAVFVTRDEEWLGNGQNIRNTHSQLYRNSIQRIIDSNYVVVRLNSVAEQLDYNLEGLYDLSQYTVSPLDQLAIVNEATFCFGGTTGATDLSRVAAGIPSLFVEGNTFRHLMFTSNTMVSPKRLVVNDSTLYRSFLREDLDLVAETIFLSDWSHERLGRIGLGLSNLSEYEIYCAVYEIQAYASNGCLLNTTKSLKSIVAASPLFCRFSPICRDLLLTSSCSQWLSAILSYH